jgi:hypothetical protein
MIRPTSVRFIGRALRRPLIAAAAVAAGSAVAVSAWSDGGHSAHVRRGVVARGGMACGHGLPAALLREIDRRSLAAADPLATRLDLINRITLSPTCFSAKMSPAQANMILNQFQMLPPTLPPELMPGPDDLRYFTSSPVWSTNGSQTSSGRAGAAQLTYSFPADGTAWDGGNNVLAARLGTTFGATNVDRGHELIRQALAAWRRDTGITYTQVADDNVAFTQSTTRVATRGDIRIGSRPYDGAFGVLAYNYFPAQGGDMVLDADDFTGSSFGSTGNNYRFFRNTVAHEHGHGLAYFHTTPCNNTKLMEPQLSTSFEPLPIDDVRGGQRNYGDRFAGNNSAANAVNFGDLTTPILKSIIERNLSTNGATGVNNTSQDWFRFTLSSTQNVVITIDPTGGSYQNGQQTSGCQPSTPPTVVADQAGDLAVELRDSTGNTVLMSSTGAAAGVNEVITANNLAAGTYTVRVFDQGPNTASNQIVQTYDMTIRVGSATAPPQACAGVNKRIAAGTTCWFMGNINSRATETGATITTYAWDLDGDGTFEIANNSQPTRTYSVNGTYNVTLRVTDSNGKTDTDTIQVTVFGGAGGVTLTGVSPSSGPQSTSVPVTLTGTGLGNLTSSSNVTVSGTGVTVIGTPVPNGGGTQVTGLTFVVISGAAPGPRNVTVTTVDGSSTLTGGFTVIANATPTLTGVTPNFGRQGFTVPVTLTGTNLNAVVSADEVSVSGTGVTVVGTPVPAAGNTQLTGLSFVIDIDAPSSLDYRTVSISTADGDDTLVNGFIVRCLADWNGDGTLTPADIAAFVNFWSNDISNGTLTTDVDHNGQITPGDVAVFVSAWFNALSVGCS